MTSGRISTSAKARQLWQGRSSGEQSPLARQIGESISLDIQLYLEDLLGSAAHARMLGRLGILSSADLDQILPGLAQIKREIESGRMELQIELEDIHTHIETRLIEICGDLGKKLHTARSRNDQVAVDTHLYVRRACADQAALLLAVLRALMQRATENIDTIVAGYTHLQVAQPIRLAHHLLAHFWLLEKSMPRLQQANRQARILPLGSGAMAGVNYPTDRDFLAAFLGFDSIAPNSMAAVAGRDHITDYLYAAATIMQHASRICEEIILWNSVEFGFISLPDELTTGSSIMPQKKNPDLAELIRGKYGRVWSNLNNVLVTLKSLPLTYNRDLQEDRWPLLDSRRQLDLSLPALEAMIQSMQFHPERMRSTLASGYATATDLADALVQQKNLSFREAHHLVGALVALAHKEGKVLSELSPTERGTVSVHFVDEAFYTAAIDLYRSADRKISAGGTARTRIEEQLRLAESRLDFWESQEWYRPPFEWIEQTGAWDEPSRP
ncbi:MAG: argininosuccinate lyase [Leptospiraceae bacterium]|nr:argininosuccinate lyase [Leptospiraceae bacterium]